jgi:hypothetical protein
LGDKKYVKNFVGKPKAKRSVGGEEETSGVGERMLVK